MEWAGNVRDVSVYGLQATFIMYWMQQIGGLLVREHAKVGSAAAKGDFWPRWARRANPLDEVVAGAV